MAHQQVIALYPNLPKASEAEHALLSGERIVHQLAVVAHDGVHPASQHLDAEHRSDEPTIGRYLVVAEVDEDSESWAESVCERFQPDLITVRPAAH